MGAVLALAVGVGVVVTIVALSGLGGLATLWKVSLIPTSIIRIAYDDDGLGGSHGHGRGASTLATAWLAGGNIQQGDSLAGS